MRYRQYQRDGTIVEAYWLTDFSPQRVSTRTLYRLAKGRRTIENQGFNDSKSRYGLDYVPHHQPTRLLIHGLPKELGWAQARGRSGAESVK